jgi:hypothetical protein
MKAYQLSTQFAVALFSVFLVSGCGKEPQEPRELSAAEKVLQGEHQLRKMAERTEVNSRISGGFFLFVGGMSGKTSTDVSVKFSWKMNDGTYAISSLPIEKIRVKLDEKAIAPTVTFHYSGFLGDANDLQSLMMRRVDYAVVTTTEANWPIQVDLPLNQ